MFNEQHKKESPILGLLGMGGGIAMGGGATPIDASGGTKYTPGNGYVYHVFQYPNSDTFTVNSGSGDINYLLVAGGGAGGMGASDAAGGGGAGQVLSLTSPNFGSGTYPVTVGQGGTRYTGPTAATTHGGDTTFNSTTAGGGGMGASGRWSPSLTPPGTRIPAQDGRPGTPGGSGSGGGGGASAFTTAGATGSPPGGNPGGDGGMGSAGGGAGGAGQDDATSPSGPFSAGGAGLAVPIYPGPLFSSMPSPWQSAVGPTGLFGGGGGASYPDGGTGPGGPGGGGNSAPGPDSSGSPGLNGTGGGGGGGGADRSDPQTNQPGGNGGHGICIIRYEA